MTHFLSGRTDINISNHWRQIKKQKIQFYDNKYKKIVDNPEIQYTVAEKFRETEQLIFQCLKVRSNTNANKENPE